MVCKIVEDALLKEKLPQAFMKIGWMENDLGTYLFQQKFGQIWTILCFLKILINFVYTRPLRWRSATICDVTYNQLSNGTAHKFHQKKYFHGNVSSHFN